MLQQLSRIIPRPGGVRDILCILTKMANVAPCIFGLPDPLTYERTDHL